MIELRGAAARTMIQDEVRDRLQQLASQNEQVRLGLFRVGARDDDLQYERSILRSCEKLGILVDATAFSEDVAEQDLIDALSKAGQDPNTDGILLFRPLPKRLQTERILQAIPPQKDIDGALLENSRFVPCTPEACMYLLKAYDIPVKGKNCVVIGRSPVVGKPLANLLREAGANVTVCHTQTKDVPGTTQQAEILFVACGKPQMVDRTYLKEGQTVIDVGFHATEDGFCGDVNDADAEEMAAAYTPVPGGVGAVTLSVLLLHAVQAHERNRT